MKYLILIVTICNCLAVDVPAECDQLGILIYEELGCKAVYEEGQACPTHYVCEDYVNDKNKCNFQGRNYKEGETIDGDDISKSCQASCRCDGGNKFTCAVLDCPEWLGVRVPPNCYSTYDLNKCCSTGKKCEPYDSLATCEYENKTYKEGERFSPKSRCYVCNCQNDFNGTLDAPHCRRTNCGFETKHADKISRNCAPTFFKGDTCCPATFACPSDDDDIKESDKTTEQKCKYGDKLLSIGDSFSKKVDFYGSPRDTTCTCQIPPLVTCIAN